MIFDVASTENICVPASIDTAAATHGIAKPLECLVTMWFPLNTPGPPPPYIEWLKNENPTAVP